MKERKRDRESEIRSCPSAEQYNTLISEVKEVSLRSLYTYTQLQMVQNR